MNATTPTPAETTFVGHQLNNRQLVLLAQDNAEAASAVRKVRAGTTALAGLNVSLTAAEFQALKLALSGENALVINHP